MKRNSVLVTLLLKSLNDARQTADGKPVSPGPILQSRYGFYLWNVDTDTYPWVLSALEEHFSHVMAMKELADHYNAPFILFSTYLEDSGLKGSFRARLAGELPYYLNVWDTIMEAADGRRAGWRYNGHWNILGNRLAAEAMYRYLREAGAL
jgi:hypothetical protein